LIILQTPGLLTVSPFPQVAQSQYFTTSSLVSGDAMKWQVQIMNWRDELGIPKGSDESSLACRPWTLSKQRKYRGLSVTPRVLAILDCVTIQMLGGFEMTKSLLQQPDATFRIEHAMEAVICDVSQNPVRRAFSNSQGIAKCQTTSSILYSFGADRIVTAYEQMLLQGHSRSMQLPDSMKQKDVSDLAGMGISLPCFAACIVAMLCTCGV